MLGPPTPEEQEREEKLKKLVRAAIWTTKYYNRFWSCRESFLIVVNCFWLKKKEKGVKKEEQKEEGAGDAGTSGAEGDEENKEENKDEEKEGEESGKEEKKPRGRGKSKAKGAAGKKPAAKGKKKKGGLELVTLIDHSFHLTWSSLVAVEKKSAWTTCQFPPDLQL